MGKTPKTLTLFLLISFLTFNSCSQSGYKTFDIDRYENQTNRIAHDYFEALNLESLSSFAFRNVAILEFTVEYLVDLPDETYPMMTNGLYDIFVQYLEENTGLQVVEKEKVSASPLYMHLRKRRMSQRWEEPKGIFRKTRKKDNRISITYSASHLGILIDLRDNPNYKTIRSSENEWVEPGVLHDVDADAAMKVHTIVDFEKDKEGGRFLITALEEPVVDTKVDIFVGYTKNLAPAVGYPSKDGNNYIFRYNDRASFRLRKPIVSYEMIRSNKNVFNLEEFAFRAQEMFSVYSDMFSRQLAEYL